METFPASQLLLPSVLHFVGIVASAIIAIGAIGAWRQLPQPRAVAAAVLVGCLLTFSIGSLVALSIFWTEGLEFGNTKGNRFDVLCESAGLKIIRRQNGAQGVLVIAGQKDYGYYGYMGPPNPMALLATANVQFVETQSIESGKAQYYRFSRPARMEKVANSEADVLVVTKPLTTDGEMKAGIYGEEMLITERHSGQALATLRYFWTIPRPMKSCPIPKQGINTSQVVSYVVGLKDPEVEQRWREAFIP